MVKGWSYAIETPFGDTVRTVSGRRQDAGEIDPETESQKAARSTRTSRKQI